MTISLVLVGLLAIYIIMVIACGGFAMHRCFGSDWSIINNKYNLIKLGK